MKITFTCKLTMSDDIPDNEIEHLYSKDEIIESLIKDLKETLTEKGIVNLSDCKLAVIKQKEV